MSFFTDVSEDTLQSVISRARDYAATRGILLRAENSTILNHHAPFTLLPTAFPKNLFFQAKEVQEDFNLLVHRVSLDHEFLKSSLASTISSDGFTARLFNIYEKIRSEGIAQPIALGILRSEYMLDHDKPSSVNGAQSGFPDSKDLSIKQIEVNTIASSFGGLGSLMGELHRYVFQQLKRELDTVPEKIPNNGAIRGIAEGLAEAWKLYGSKEAVVLAVCNSDERNVFDQKWIEHHLSEINPSIKFVRRSLTDIAKSGQINEEKNLYVDEQEVAVVYFRSGYAPDQYPTENEWSARLTMERSRAIKCPNIAYHLVGTKKVQQVLAAPGVLERFISEDERVNRIRRTFAGLYTLDEGPDGDKAVELAMRDPDRYVLKPQREGGGNNTFGEDIPKVLCGMKDVTERSQYILMDRVRSPAQKNYIVRAELDKIVPSDVVSELGIFGIVIGTNEKILVNKEIGHLLRTKSTGHDDGGVSSGRANLDSPFLV